jgi:hypothetical protein
VKIDKILEVVSATKYCLNWIRNSNKASLLNQFPDALNIVNQDNQVVSIVSEKIGNSPFNLVINGDNSLYTSEIEKLLIQKRKFFINEYFIEVKNAVVWNPIFPEVSITKLKAGKLINSVSNALLKSNNTSLLNNYDVSKNSIEENIVDRLSNSISIFMDGIQNFELEKISAGSRKIAGLGIGLTPTGDDYLLGGMAACWLLYSREKAEAVCKTIHSSVLDRTNTLSYSWLRAMANREGSEKWHQLFISIQEDFNKNIDDALFSIVNTGNSSGEDSLIGFRDVLSSESISK